MADSTVPNWTWPWCCCISNQILCAPSLKITRACLIFLVTAFFVRLFWIVFQKQISVQQRKRNETSCCSSCVVTLLLNSAKFVFLKFVIILNMSLFPKIGFLRSSAKWRRKTCLKVVAAIEDATGKGLGGPRHFIGFVRTWHKRKQRLYIYKGYMIVVTDWSSTWIFRDDMRIYQQQVEENGMCSWFWEYFMPNSGPFKCLNSQVLSAHQLQQVSNGELWAN